MSPNAWSEQTKERRQSRREGRHQPYDFIIFSTRCWSIYVSPGFLGSKRGICCSDFGCCCLEVEGASGDLGGSLGWM